MSQTRRFQFLKIIATGGFGEVYLCKEINANGIDRLVAIKVLKSDWIDNIDVVNRLRNEAKLLALLRHKNIINVFDLTSINGRASIIMEYVEGADLSIIIETMRANRRRTPTSVSLQICAKVAAALDLAYNQSPFPGESPLRVVHRDIKPGNIMIDIEGTLKILDFGVAHSMFEQRVSNTSELRFGSLEYMAPERLLFEPETPASDIYALALVLFECITGEAFGEASKQKDEHQELVDNRLRFLGTLIYLPIAQEQELLSLFRVSLCYEPEERCTPLEFHQRSRALSRTIQGADLIPWAEKAIPIIRKASRVVIEEGAGKLQGQTLEEDALIGSDRLPIPIGDDETEIRDTQYLEEARALVSFVEVQPLPEEDGEQGTEIFVQSERTETDAKHSSYFQGDSTISILGNPVLRRSEGSDDVTEVREIASQRDFFLEEESVVSVVVQPLPFSEPKTQVRRVWWWGTIMVFCLCVISTLAFLYREPLFLLWTGSEHPSPVEQEEPLVVEPDKKEVQDIPFDAIVFVVEEEGKRLNVICDGESKTIKKTSNGEMKLFFTQKEAKKCKVRFVSSSGKRIQTTQKELSSGVFLCFFDNKEHCVRREE
jgi:serine/threonine protein kinase